jgi:phosphorylcholine metabolism protein LicD
MDEKVAIETLRQVKEVLDNYDVEYWLDYGTLLGAVRNGKIIPWDNDIDLSMWKKNKEKLPFVLNDLNLKGFKIYCGEFIIAFRKNNSLICLDLYDLTDGKAIRESQIVKNFVGEIIGYLNWVISAWDHKSVCEGASIVTKFLHKILFMIRNTSLKGFIFGTLRKLHRKVTYTVVFEVPSHYFKNLSTIKYYGLEFKVPSTTEEYLTYRYGPDWKIPKKDYIYYEEDGAIRRSFE